jgi:hypothetical protein
MDTMISEIKKTSPTGINRPFMVAEEKWAWLNYRGNLISDAFQGVFISLSFALIVIFIITLNLIVSTLSVFCIASIIVQMMSMINILGWHFGVIESICVIVFVGISVDYVSHFAHMYIHAPFHGRRERTDYAYQQMG